MGFSGRALGRWRQASARQAQQGSAMREVIATSALKASEEFTRPLPSLVVAFGYACAFFFLTLTLRSIPIGVAYALWSGCGIVLICALSWILFKQSLDAP